MTPCACPTCRRREMPDALVAATPLLLLLGLWVGIGSLQLWAENRRVRRERAG